MYKRSCLWHAVEEHGLLQDSFCNGLYAQMWDKHLPSVGDPVPIMPALLTSTSQCLWLLRNFLTVSFRDAESIRSHEYVSTSGAPFSLQTFAACQTPRAVMQAIAEVAKGTTMPTAKVLTSSRESLDLATSAMLAPSAAKVSATALPIPLPPPVMKHHLPLSRPDGAISLRHGDTVCTSAITVANARRMSMVEPLAQFSSYACTIDLKCTCVRMRSGVCKCKWIKYTAAEVLGRSMTSAVSC